MQQRSRQVATFCVSRIVNCKLMELNALLIICGRVSITQHSDPQFIGAFSHRSSRPTLELGTPPDVPSLFFSYYASLGNSYAPVWQLRHTVFIFRNTPPLRTKVCKHASPKLGWEISSQGSPPPQIKIQSITLYLSGLLPVQSCVWQSTHPQHIFGNSQFLGSQSTPIHTRCLSLQINLRSLPVPQFPPAGLVQLPTLPLPPRGLVVSRRTYR